MNGKELNIELYKKVYLIRKASDKIVEHYLEDEMKTPVHLSNGEEAIPSGVCHALEAKDILFGSCRSHGLFLARTGDSDKFFGELYGKKSGVAKGKSGSMHLTHPEMNLMGTAAIVAGSIPIGVGAALANKYKKEDRLTVIFFGDGAVDEGVFWESLNFACLKKLPILFICEDNDFAVHSRKIERHGYSSLINVASQFECNVFETESTDPETIYYLTKKAIETHKHNGKPCLINARYYRYYEHVGTFEDFKYGYRSREEFEKWYEKDPVIVQRNKLVKNYCNEEEVKKIEEEINLKVERSIKSAKEADFPEDSELYTDIFA